MPSVRPLWFIAGFLVTLSGCAQSGSLLSQRTTVGSLKASLSHLDYENQQLRREVASLKNENREFENRLVQEEAINGDLSARLDDARSVLAQRGLDGGSSSNLDSLDPVPRKTLPTGQSNRKRRKPPFAQIPGRIDVLPPSSDDSTSSPGWGKSADPAHDDPGPTSGLDRSSLWLPVARGATEPPNPRR